MVVIALTRPPPGPPLHPKKHTVPPLLCAASSLPVPFSPPGDAHVGRWGHGDTTHMGGAQCHPHPPQKSSPGSNLVCLLGQSGVGDGQTDVGRVTAAVPPPQQKTTNKTPKTVNSPPRPAIALLISQY